MLKKKSFSLVLALLMAVTLVLSACGGSESASESGGLEMIQSN